MAARNAQGRLLLHGVSARWVRNGPLDGRPLLLLAHGAGAPMDSAFMQAVTEALVDRELAVARFHFAYMQRVVDEGRRRPPDAQPRLLESWRAMLACAARWKGVQALVMGGKSMGARMASLVLAEQLPERVVAACYLGFPLHPPDRPGVGRAAHLPQVSVPQLFVSGDRDALAQVDLLQEVVGAAGRGARLMLIPGADHSLARGRRELLADGECWLDAVAAFVKQAAGP